MIEATTFIALLCGKVRGVLLTGASGRLRALPTARAKWHGMRLIYSIIDAPLLGCDLSVAMHSVD